MGIVCEVLTKARISKDFTAFSKIIHLLVKLETFLRKNKVYSSSMEDVASFHEHSLNW